MTGSSNGSPTGLGDRLPIKLILPNQGAARPVPSGGSRPEPFRTVDADFRRSLRTQLHAVSEALSPHFRRSPAAPVRVKLLDRAVAKSHRPTQLFSDATCPIIGAGGLGELFLRATPRGLVELERTIEQGTSQRIVKELSTVEAIEPVTSDFRRKRKSSSEILQRSPRVTQGGAHWFLTRIRLFDVAAPSAQELLVQEFLERCRQLDILATPAGYDLATNVFAVACRTDRELDELARVVGVRSIAAMPTLRTIRVHATNDGPLPPGLPDAAQVDGDYPVVVVVDSGITDRVPALNGWVAGRASTVADAYRNSSHGSFVAGLVVWGDRLNPQLQDVDTQPCGVFDLQVIPNWDPARGDTEVLTEQEFLQALESALRSYANRYKVWNLSLGTDEVCVDGEFSPLAEQLDNLQERYQVSFVVSAGNYETLPLLDFPRHAHQRDAGRITAPADSVLAITVGSISHVDYQTRGPRQHEPSPFSRHGSGPNCIIKPDVVHYGGTCTTDGQHRAGIRSVTENGCAEDLGTSFATPLVSRSLAQIYHQITPTPSQVLARALLTHHARDPRSGGRVTPGDEDYFGFGRPLPPPYCLACEPHQSTLVFEDTLRPGFFLEWDDFPFPPSLRRNGKYFGEIWMTIAFAPSRGARWGTEYCETHVDATFGVYRTQRSRKGVVSQKFVGLVPPEHMNPGRLYEDVQVRELRKWAPVRTYHGALGSGERGERWRLKVRLLTRHDAEPRDRASQPFALIVTITDPERRAPVYDEMAQLVRTRYQANNLAVRAAARVRSRA